MKKYSSIARWGPVTGVLAVGMLAFSLSLEGAAPSPQPQTMKERAVNNTNTSPESSSNAAREIVPTKQTAPERSGHALPAIPMADQLPEGIKFGRMPKGDLPIREPMIVDYRDDTGTRMRQAGLLVGPYRPDQGRVATSCSFDIQCDDCNPCTQDVCNIAVGAPLGSGTCINSVLPNGAEGGCSDGLCCNGRETCQGGVCQAPGSGSGTFDPNACQFPCSGGTVCNEDTNLCRVACTGANTCSITGGPCQSTNDCIPPVVANAPEGNYCLNCNDGVNCNGVETCVSGACEAGTNPCGPGGICGEKDCSGAGTTPCTTDSDCSALQLGTCTKPGPICFPGRCCDNATAEPACTKRQKSGGTCSGGSNPSGNCQTNAQCQVCTTGPRIGNPCTSAAQCGGGTCGAAGTCTVSASCDGVGGKWYATDDGQLPFSGGTVCPTPPQGDADRTICPKYSSGIAPLVNFDTETAFVVGLFSQGPCDHLEIGDDYGIENLSSIAMEKFRWVGGGGGRLLIEFYDENGNFIEDAVTGGIGGANAVNALVFAPPLTIPAKGFWVVSVATNFAPNGQTFVTATDAVDEGTNKVSGTGSLWFDGAPSAITLRECVGGTRDGAWCDPDDLGDSRCVGGGGVCQNRNNVLAFEIEGLKVATPTGACCNDTNGTCTAGVLPWVCTGQGNNYQGNDSTCPGTCGLGACCATNGTCSVTTGAACTGGSTFQGFGTDCEPNCCLQPFSGGDNCNNATVKVIHVPDPGDPAAVVTISGSNAPATGPDSCLKGAWNAVGGTYLTVDPGWWQAFSIDDCAFVRVDYCCSDPVAEPAWAVLWSGCPCDDQLFTAVNPNVPDEPANKRGSPYCNDDNLWNKFGPLPGGTCTGGSAAGKACTASNQCPGGTCSAGHTYYIPIYSEPPGTHASYQMHITVDACPLAACCNGTSCVETDQLGCANIDGANFLAPPFRTVAVTTCQASTCNTGSCCYVPGQGLCQDIITGQLATETLCNGSSGEYKGGTRCKGCICAAGTPAKSCNTDADCGAEGPCNNPTGGACSGQDKTQPSPCPACDIESTANCQRLGDITGVPTARLSDDCVGDCVSDPPQSDFSLPTIRVADDFVATVGGNITNVCVWGSFLDQNNGLADCSSTNPPEKFRVKLYNDASGLPGSVVGNSSTTLVRKADTGLVRFGGNVLQYQLALNTPLAVTAGNTYWLEIVNNTDESSGLPGCDWFWWESNPSQGADAGNKFFFQDAGDSYTFGDARFDGADMAWCINLDNSVPPIKQAACCTCGGGVGGCAVMTLENCTNADGSWQPTHADCIGVVCPNSHGTNDNCASKTAVGNNSATAWNNYCTNTDGPASGGNNDCSSGLDYQNDVWFSWTADCTGDVIIETCDNGGEIDTGMMIYTDGTGTCPCPSSAANEIDCSDDGCVFTGAASRITVPATTGTCYTIRVAGFLGEKGTGFLHVGDCGGAPAPQTPLADPSGINKIRFISFSVAGPSAETALRVKLNSLHHVSPPYAGDPTVAFSTFEGQSVYVGPPQSWVESSGSGIPFKSAVTQCTPFYHDWTTEGLIHVRGSAIVPSSQYAVENLAASCLGVEGSAACVSGGASVSGQLAISTTRWGDLAEAFNPPSTTTQPNFTDVSGLIDKFKDVLGAPIKARTLISPNDAFGNINDATMGVNVGFTHIAACVDAFKGKAYPAKMGKCSGAGTAACTVNGDCSSGGNVAPCVLYCP